MADRRLFALLGHPVRHSVSPVMHSAAFRALDLPHVYSAYDVPTEADLARFVGDLRSGLFAGANVTLPHKQRVLSMVDDVDESAREVGAANVLVRTPDRRVVAYNTDVPALADALEGLLAGGAPMVTHAPRAVREVPQSMRHRAVILGAGGAGLAATAACRRLGFTLISVTSRSWSSSQAMLEAAAGERARALGALTAPWPKKAGGAPSSRSSMMLRLNWSETAAIADLVVQATSAGMLGGPPGEDAASIVPWDSLGSHARAFDVVYNPPVTPFLRLARMRGLRAMDGVSMLVGQAARSFTLWTGLEAPVDVMCAAAEESLERAASVR
ncbi:MAG: shikimate dehydrogenase [Polyangiaceae bacterium]|nr:shikimate dehydrogenase [Polyangiaceae bacterium]